jgi:hypothetical protein
MIASQVHSAIEDELDVSDILSRFFYAFDQFQIKIVFAIKNDKKSN